MSPTARRILIVHGPNLNTLGTRQPEIYGDTTLAEIHERLGERADAAGYELAPFQSNHEGALIDFLQAEAADASGIIINPGGLSHTSVSLRDALTATDILTIEVHLSNIHAREPFRHTSLTAGACRGVIAGLGWRGYLLALEALIELIEEQREP